MKYMTEKIGFVDNGGYGSGICQIHKERIYLTRNYHKLALRYDFSNPSGKVSTGLKCLSTCDREATAWPTFQCEMITIGLGEAVKESDIRAVNELIQPHVSLFQTHYNQFSWGGINFSDLQDQYVELGRKAMLTLASKMPPETLNLRKSWPSVESAFRYPGLRDFLTFRRTNTDEIYDAAFQAVFFGGMPFHPYDIVALLNSYPGGPLDPR